MPIRDYTCQHDGCAQFACCPMLVDQVWEPISPNKRYPKRGLLCTEHAEARLGRPLKLSDLLDCPGNRPYIRIIQRALGLSETSAVGYVFDFGAPRLREVSVASEKIAIAVVADRAAFDTWTRRELLCARAVITRRDLEGEGL